jgi:hypothetical protein
VKRVSVLSGSRLGAAAFVWSSLSVVGLAAAQSPTPKPPAPASASATPAAAAKAAQAGSAKAGTSAGPGASAAPLVGSARPLTAAEMAAPPPHGTPTGDDDDPHGRGGDPHGMGGDPHAAGGDPHGHGGEGRPAMPRQSESREDASLAPGTIAVEVRDGMGKPLADTDVTLGIVINSVAKGESRKRLSGKTNAEGVVLFPDLEIASINAYRASVAKDGASYAAPPFGLPKVGGMRATIIVYPVEAVPAVKSMAVQGFVFIEIKDEVMVIEELFRVFNLGQTTWLPKDVVIALPEGFKALNAQKQMSDIGVDPVPGQGVRLRGTFAPGQNEVSFRYQVPHDGTSEVTLPLGLPPNVQSMQVVVEATKGLAVTVPGFPPTMMKTGENGVRLIGTVRETERVDPAFRSIEVKLSNVPTKPWGRYGAAGIALGLAALGLSFVVQKRKPSVDEQREERDELIAARNRVLVEIDALETAHEAGEVGPKTYERVRRELVDALAGILRRLD